MKSFTALLGLFAIVALGCGLSQESTLTETNPTSSSGEGSCCGADGECCKEAASCCGTDGECCKDGHPHPHGEGTSDVSLTLCCGCGELKGTEACCADGAETCSCGLHKGSPGCCKMEAGEDLALCVDCGFAEGADECCSEDGESCSCGWQKGSPACCKIDKPATEDMAADTEEEGEESEG